MHHIVSQLAQQRGSDQGTRHRRAFDLGERHDVGIPAVTVGYGEDCLAHRLALGLEAAPGEIFRTVFAAGAVVEEVLYIPEHYEQGILSGSIRGTGRKGRSLKDTGTGARGEKKCSHSPFHGAI